MRASELIAQLQEIMEDHHCDPDVEVQTGFDYTRHAMEAEVETEEAWQCEYVSRRKGQFSSVIIRIPLKVRAGHTERY